MGHILHQENIITKITWNKIIIIRECRALEWHHFPNDLYFSNILRNKMWSKFLIFQKSSDEIGSSASKLKMIMRHNGSHYQDFITMEEKRNETQSDLGLYSMIFSTDVWVLKTFRGFELDKAKVLCSDLKNIAWFELIGFGRKWWNLMPYTYNV